MIPIVQATETGIHSSDMGHFIVQTYARALLNNSKLKLLIVTAGIPPSYLKPSLWTFSNEVTLLIADWIIGPIISHCLGGPSGTGP